MTAARDTTAVQRRMYRELRERSRRQQRRRQQLIEHRVQQRRERGPWTFRRHTR